MEHFITALKTRRNEPRLCSRDVSPPPSTDRLPKQQKEHRKNATEHQELHPCRTLILSGHAFRAGAAKRCVTLVTGTAEDVVGGCQNNAHADHILLFALPLGNLTREILHLMLLLLVQLQELCLFFAEFLKVTVDPLALLVEGSVASGFRVGL